MTNAPAAPETLEADTEWWTRPPVVLPIVAGLVLIVALLSPQPSTGRFGDPRLSSRSSGSLGARVFSETARRLGWRVTERIVVGAPAGADGRTVHALLAPSIPVTPEEAHAYLQAVRAGDGLLFVIGRRTPLSDSLGVAALARDGILHPGEVTSQCTTRRELAPPLWPDGEVHLVGVRWLRGIPPGIVSFGRLSRSERRSADPGVPAYGFPLGAGRIIVAADPDLFRNDALRHCRWNLDLLAVRMLEWLRDGNAGPRTALVFDEYHQGFGRRVGVLDVMVGFLVRHPVGRGILQLCLVGVVLLLATAPRPLRPREQARTERRDPMEQVDALAHAYEQVGATRTATARLLRGVRRRVHRGADTPRGRGDAEFLRDALARAPVLGDDVRLVQRALDTPVALRAFTDVGAALRRIEHTLTTTRA